MSQASMTIDGTQPGSTVITQINNALAALITLASGASAPSASGQPIAYQLWADTTNNVLKMRNAASTAWINLGPLAGLAKDSIVHDLVVSVGTGDLTACAITASLLSVQGTVLQSVSETMDTNTAAGADAIDTGSWATNTWYALFIICNEDGSSVASLASLSSSSPTLPSGYTRFRRVGWVRTTGTATNLRTFRQEGNFVVYDINEDFTPLNAGTSTTHVDVACAAYAPPTARRLYLFVKAGGAAAVNTTFHARINGSTITVGVPLAHSNQAGAGDIGSPCFMDCDSGQIFEYKMTQGAGTGRGSVCVLGWLDNAQG